MLHARKRGRVYQLEGRIAGRRLRLSLGTAHHDAALVLCNKMERALAEGKESKLWPELSAILPPATFGSLAALVGYEDKRQQPPTWELLTAAFTTYAQRQIARGKLRQTTWRRYHQALDEFGTFLTERGASLLTDITCPLLEDFKAWRFARIRARKQSRGGGGLTLDIAILHRAFVYAVKSKMLAQNPVALDGKPGDNAERGAHPFTADQLARLREAAGPDLLAFLLLRWTALRGGDAVSLRWAEVEWKGREINRLTEKRRKQVIIPIHTELLFALETEHARRKPHPKEPVLLNPSTGKPMTRPRLYRRIRALGQRAEVADAHPHRFRDTFVVDMLLRGASPFDVAKLLGDTVATVEHHYAHYVRELRERARRLMETSEGLETMGMGTDRAQSQQATEKTH